MNAAEHQKRAEQLEADIRTALQKYRDSIGCSDTSNVYVETVDTVITKIYDEIIPEDDEEDDDFDDDDEDDDDEEDLSDPYDGLPQEASFPAGEEE